MIKLSLLFAIWEFSKLSDAAGGYMVLLLEIPYMAWGVWLLFFDFLPAVALWSLSIASIVVHLVFGKDATAKFYPFNCAISAVILAAIFLGRI